MKKVNFKMRNVVAIAICFATVTMFSACDPDDPEPSDNGADITAFTFAGINGTAVIDKDALTVTATANEAVDLTSIAATFTLSNGATAKVNGVPQVSGTTANDFSGTVTYIVTSSDGRLTNIWNVSITKGSGSNRFFGVKSGKVVYNYTQWSEDDDYTGQRTFTLIFDDYGDRIRIEEREKNGDEWIDHKTIIMDYIADIKYSYYEDDLPNYETDPTSEIDRSQAFFYCWKVNGRPMAAPWDAQLSTKNETIAENNCSVFLWEESGDTYELAEWNNIVFRDYRVRGTTHDKWEAVSFSTSIPANSFIPYGGNNTEQPGNNPSTNTPAFVTADGEVWVQDMGYGNVGAYGYRFVGGEVYYGARQNDVWTMNKIGATYNDNGTWSNGTTISVSGTSLTVNEGGTQSKFVKRTGQTIN